MQKGKEDMSSRWQEIWDKREKIDDLLLIGGVSEFELFCELKRIDGFDVSVDEGNEAYRKFLDEWISMYDEINTLTDNDNREAVKSVYEVGCGSGVNLFLFKNRIPNIKCGGIDFSQSLIETANKVVKSDDIRRGEAIEINSAEKYDVVISESVFQYFNSYEYAEAVVERMLDKANKLIYIGEISDIEFMEEQLKARRAKIENYDELYKGLERRYYSKEWFEKLADKSGRKIKFTYSQNMEYVNSKYLFNCYMY